MVNINLYRKKKAKLKISTIIVFICILLLPVVALRFTIETIKKANISEIRNSYQYSRNFIGDGSIADSISEIESQDTLIRKRTIKIANETKRVESDIIYANVASAFIGELGYQYDRFSNTEKVFIDTMTINRGADFKVKYYNVAQNLLGIHNFARELKTGYKEEGISVRSNNVNIDFMLVDILQEELTAETSSY